VAFALKVWHRSLEDSYKNHQRINGAEKLKRGFCPYKGGMKTNLPQSASLPNLFFSNQLVIPLIHQTIKSQTFLN
jgi:hypothetical protein